MKSPQYLLLFAFFFLFNNNSITATNYFIENNLEQAKQQASREGKLIMVDFWANWCNPCQWMDEQTFSDPTVAKYLSANYVSVRVDIDNLEGYKYKEEYNIRYLPSILILNAKGEVLKKYEESFAPSKLIQLLKVHNQEKPNSSSYNSSTTSSYDSSTSNYSSGYNSSTSTSTTEPEIKPAPSYKPALSADYNSSNTTTSTNDYQTSTPQTYNSTEYSTYKEEKPVVDYSASAATTYTSPAKETTYQSTATTSSTSTYNTTTNTVSNSLTTGLYQFNVYPAPTNGYSVQVGAYYEYGNVLTEVAHFQEQYKEVILVHISQLNNMPCYKILLGHFSTYEMANEHKALLKTKGLDCFIKELAAMGKTMQ